MKKYIAAVAAASALAAALIVPAGASANNTTAVNAIGENPAFVASGCGSIENVHNTALRFGDGGRIAIPGEGGNHANEISAVEEYNVACSGGEKCGGIVNPPVE
jgi:hypothetical protein